MNAGRSPYIGDLTGRKTKHEVGQVSWKKKKVPYGPQFVPDCYCTHSLASSKYRASNPPQSLTPQGKSLPHALAHWCFASQIGHTQLEMLCVQTRGLEEGARAGS
ncbi:hypothetical protein TWF594_004646, partial [Orbilia oligospora]